MTTTATREVLLQLAERAVIFMRHDGLCGVVGGYGYCTCGMSEAKEKLLALAAQQEPSQ